MSLYMARINIAFEAPDDADEAYLADAVSAMFTDNLEGSGAIIGWGYTRKGDRRYYYAEPFPIDEDTIDDMRDFGDFPNMHPRKMPF